MTEEQKHVRRLEEQIEDLIARLKTSSDHAAALRRAEELNRRIVEAMPGGIVHVSAEGAILDANSEALRILGLSFDTLTRRYTSDFETETLREDGTPCPVEEYPVSQAIITGEPQPPTTIGVRHSGGAISWAVFRAIPIKDPESGAVTGAIVTFLDVTRERETIARLRQSEDHLASLIENFPHYFATIDSEYRILYVNRVDPSTTLEEVIGSSFFDYTTPDYSAAAREVLEDVFARGSVRTLEHMIMVKGQPIDLQATFWPVYRGGEIRYVNSVASDISELKRLQRLLEYQANHDPLTALDNRLSFREVVLEAIKSARRGQEVHALAYVDLDQFKLVNDTSGHVAGDELLCQFSFLLKEAMKDHGTVARLGGDEFGILLAGRDIDSAVPLLEEFCKKAAQFRFQWNERVFSIGLSVGLTQIDSRCEGYAQILRDADTACFLAKESGRNRIHVFRLDDDSMLERREHMNRATAVAGALDRKELLLYAQEIRGASGTRAYEILSRFRGADGEIVSAAQFISAAERFDLMPRFDRDVVRLVTGCLREHFSGCGSDVDFLTVNLSGASVGDPHFQSYLSDLLAELGPLARHLCFEITETAAVRNLDTSRRFMDALVERGVSFALDDFGAGLSSFAYLRRLPIRLLKVDGSLIEGMADDEVDRIMVRSILDLCGALNLKTVAEKVSTPELEKLVFDMGFDYAQGYQIHRPAPLETIISHLATGKTNF